jgi:hypothetical protein
MEATGTARSTPKTPKRYPPEIIEKITVTGCSPTCSPRMLGLMILLSI